MPNVVTITNLDLLAKLKTQDNMATVWNLIKKYASQIGLTYNASGKTYNASGYNYGGKLTTSWNEQIKN